METTRQYPNPLTRDAAKDLLKSVVKPLSPQDRVEGLISKGRVYEAKKVVKDSGLSEVQTKKAAVNGVESLIRQGKISVAATVISYFDLHPQEFKPAVARGMERLVKRGMLEEAGEAAGLFRFTEAEVRKIALNAAKRG